MRERVVTGLGSLRRGGNTGGNRPGTNGKKKKKKRLRSRKSLADKFVMVPVDTSV